jgi:uncharacterized protein
MARRVIVGGIAGVFVCALAAPAAAHVSIDPPSVPKGSTAKISFIVPNESASARTNRVQIVFPQPPNAIPGVSVEAKPGWHLDVKTQRLPTPIQTDDGAISEVVASVTWTSNSTANAIGADEFGEFTINADGIPEEPDALVFRAVQNYSDGTSVRWVDPVSENGPEAEHPTPILVLTDGSGSATPTTAAATTPPAVSGSTTISTQDDNARALAVIGIIVGGVALIAATGALMRRRRS